MPLLRLLCNGVMPMLPTPLARKAFVAVYDRLRPNSRSMRLLERLLPPDSGNEVRLARDIHQAQPQCSEKVHAVNVLHVLPFPGIGGTE